MIHPGISCEKLLDKELENWFNNKDVQRCPKCIIIKHNILKWDFNTNFVELKKIP